MSSTLTQDKLRFEENIAYLFAVLKFYKFPNNSIFDIVDIFESATRNKWKKSSTTHP